MSNACQQTAQKLKLHGHLVTTGPLCVQLGAVSITVFPDGNAALEVLRDDVPVLYAYVRAASFPMTLTAAHQFAKPRDVETEALRSWLLLLIDPLTTNHALDRLRTAPASGGPSPWGEIVGCERVEPGVYHVVTLDHGGYWTDAQVEQLLPKPARQTDGWYEEDVAAAILAAFLGWCGSEPGRLSGVHAVLRHNFPDLLTYLDVISA